MIHLDLFSGIGGFALAVDAVWDNVEHIFCEIDPYCRALLKKRFEGSVIYGDIRQLTADTDKWESRPGNESESVKKEQLESCTDNTGKSYCDILTGGFPCQPFSQAGKRRGTSDNRFLWPEMLRVIREFKPTWVIAENVRGILTIEQGMVFEQVLSDLENIGYKVQPFIIPAVAVNAPHRRDRVWFVANNATGKGRDGGGETIADEKGHAKRPEQARVLERGFEGPYSNAPDTEQQRPIQREHQERPRPEKGLSSRNNWQKPWLEVATELCGVDDGLPAELDGLKLSKSKHRIERLKALGNSIVPQVAIEIMEAIKYEEDNLRNPKDYQPRHPDDR